MMLDKLKISSSGPDPFPAWFLRLAAPILSRSLTHIFNRSMNTGTVPTQWKASIITPVPKVKKPGIADDYRPISVTSILCRQLEHYIVEKHIYPAMEKPPDGLRFDDQYAFKPTGSATAALIATIDHVTELLKSGSAVVLVSLDFSKAFDRVRHKNLLDKFHKLSMNDLVYNWICSYFKNREHTTKFMGQLSNIRNINASVVQGSGIGPGSFSVAASDLKPKSKEIKMFKFADDIDLVTVLSNYEEIRTELVYIEKWATDNNLTLNKNKTKEIIFTKNKNIQLPSTIEGLERVGSLKKLGVVLQSKLSMRDHVDALITDCSNMWYAMKLLRNHGMQPEGLQQVLSVLYQN